MQESYSNYCIPKIQKTALFNLMRDVTDLLSLNNIQYWIDGGSLLGCVRHDGQLPHDDDVDLGVWEADFYKKLPKLFDNFKEKGYHVSYKAGIDEIIQIFIPNL